MIDPYLKSLLNIEFPIIQAPMAGGITTTELVLAVSQQGGLGSIGAGYMTATALEKQINEIQMNMKSSFNVNLFVPQPFTEEEDISLSKEYLEEMRKQLKMPKQFSVELPTFKKVKENYDKQLDVVIENKVPVVSFTFGLPSEDVMAKLCEAGITTMATATTVEEAVAIEKLGIDIVIAQGSEAGGHRGNFLQDTDHSLIGLMSLIPQVVDAVKIPVIAAGGIMDRRGIEAARALGASAVQLGTAFLTTVESGAHKMYKQAVLEAEETDTVLTKSFSGKNARGLRNEFINQLEDINDRLPAYPIQNTLTHALRKHAQERNDIRFMSLWSGQSPRLARSHTVASLMKQLIDK